MCPGLLAYRIWTIEHAVSMLRASKSNVMPIVRVLVDAAILYTVVLFIALACFVCLNNGVFVVVDMVIPPLTLVIETC
jgi:hypothetical protein